MPIDPSIAMGFKSPDINLGRSALAGVDVNTMQAENANLQAANPGIVAESAIKTRDAAWQQWLSQNAQNYRKTDAQGNDAGPDFPAMIAASNGAGFPDKSEALAAAHADRLTKDISNVKDQTNVDLLKPQAVNTMMANIASQVDTTADPATQALQYKRARDVAVHASGGQGSYADQMLPQQPPKDVASWKIGMHEATISPEKQQDISIQKQNANSSTLSAVTQSKNQQMSAAGNDVVAQEHLAKSTTYQDGFNAANSVTSVPTWFGSKAQALVQKYVLQDPVWKRINQAVDQHNQDYPGRPLSITDGLPTIKQVLSQDAKQQNGMAIAHSNIASVGGINTPGTNTSVPAKTTNAPMVTIKRLSDGKILTMPAAEAQKRLDSKLYTAQ